MKKIMFVIADLGAGGAQRVIASLANEFARQPDYHVDVVSLSAPHEGTFFDFHPDVVLRYAAVNRASKGFLSGVLANLKRVAVLRGILKELQADAVISFLAETNCKVLLSAAGLGVPVIVSERSDPYLYPDIALWRVLRRVTYPLATHLVCQTQYAADYFGNMPCKSVIYNPVLIAEGTGAIPCAEPYILGVGRQSHEKGFDLLIRAHAHALSQGVNLKLVLAGDGPDRAQLVHLTQTLGTSSQVIFAGAQPDLSGYYRHAHMFVLPSRFEGMPNALLEAMAYGCAVVVTPDFRAATEIVTHGHNGVIAKSATPAAFADQIIDLYNDFDRKQRVAAQACADSHRFDNVAIATQWRELITRFL